ncbi:MAG: hypothetical protein ACPHIV_07440, partial [Candidatus Puniceispirillaceae bacterium]
MFLFLHHFKAGHQHLVWDDSSSELRQQVIINVIGQIESVSLFLKVTLVEGEGLLVGLCLRHRCFFVL